MKVLCIGHACYDMCLPLDSFPTEDSKMEVSTLLESGGGPAANATYLLSSWGVDCGFAGLIGDDSYGVKVIEEFQTIGTDISMLEVRKGYKTPFSVILVNKQNGSRTIINRKIEKSTMHSEYMNRSDISPAILLFDGHEPAASLKAMELFPNALTVLDAGSMREGTDILSRRVDYLVCSKRFALSVSGLSDIRTGADRQKCVEEMQKMNPRQVVVTLGQDGLIYNKNGELSYLPAFPADAKDTTGAGDIFHGAFVYGVLQNMPLDHLLKFSSMTAALSIEVQGGRPSIPSLQKVFAALAK